MFDRLGELASEHAEPLFANSHGPGRESLWTYLFNGPFENLADFAVDVEGKACGDERPVGCPGRLPF